MDSLLMRKLSGHKTMVLHGNPVLQYWYCNNTILHGAYESTVCATTAEEVCTETYDSKYSKSVTFVSINKCQCASICNPWHNTYSLNRTRTTLPDSCHLQAVCAWQTLLKTVKLKGRGLDINLFNVSTKQWNILQ